MPADQLAASPAAELFPYQLRDQAALSASHHWADRTAQAIIAAKGDKDLYVLAAGITPSGVVHIGNFRELIIVDLVGRALRALGKQTRFIFSWDDYDPLRKIPSNFPATTPQGQPFNTYMGMPLSVIPDPLDQFSSYAERNEKTLERSLKKVGVTPIYRYQSVEYQKGTYCQAIKESLQHRAQLRAILNEQRPSSLPEDWLPVLLYCQTCRKNVKNVLSYDEKTTFTYHCAQCNKEKTLDFSVEPYVKLRWRIDWPMRWRHEQVDFEPGGKDHSSAGGSFTTAKLISQQVFNYPPPYYLQYDFVLVKDDKAKMSSSKGNVMTIDNLLQVYEPAMVRWLYVQPKPNVDFSIALDKDVIKNYEAFDKLQRAYFGQDSQLSYKKTVAVKRLYELAQVKFSSGKLGHKTIAKPLSFPVQIPFRHLTSVAQVYDFDKTRIATYYSDQLIDAAAEKQLFLRLQCAKNWLKNYAEREFCFVIRKTPLVPTRFSAENAFSTEFSTEFSTALAEMIAKIEDGTAWDQWSEQELFDYLYQLIRRNGVENRYFFEKIYQILINRPQGPRLAMFMKILGRKRLLELFAPFSATSVNF